MSSLQPKKSSWLFPGLPPPPNLCINIWMEKNAGGLFSLALTPLQLQWKDRFQFGGAVARIALGFAPHIPPQTAAC